MHRAFNRNNKRIYKQISKGAIVPVLETMTRRLVNPDISNEGYYRTFSETLVYLKIGMCYKN